MASKKKAKKATGETPRPVAGFVPVDVAVGPNPDGLTHQAEIAHASSEKDRDRIAKRVAADRARRRSTTED
jgi:hypothetical protein